MEVERGVIEGQFTGLDFGKIEHVVDDRQQGFRTLVNGREVILLARGHGRAVQQFGEAENAVERGANLVAHVGQELGFDMAGFQGFLARHVQFDVLDLDGFQGFAQILGGLIHVLLQLGLGVGQCRDHLSQGGFQFR